MYGVTFFLRPMTDTGEDRPTLFQGTDYHFDIWLLCLPQSKTFSSSCRKGDQDMINKNRCFLVLPHGHRREQVGIVRSNWYQQSGRKSSSPGHRFTLNGCHQSLSLLLVLLQPLDHKPESVADHNKLSHSVCLGQTYNKERACGGETNGFWPLHISYYDERILSKFITLLGVSTGDLLLVDQERSNRRQA